MKLILFAMVLVGASAQAHSRNRNCLIDKWIFESVVGASTGDCRLADPLSLAVGRFDYPGLRGGPFDVRYWHGSYSRSVIVTKRYRHYVSDRCTRTVVLNEPVDRTVSSSESFPVKNPNLDRSITESFQLSPMTDDEAAAALEQAKQECEGDLK